MSTNFSNESSSLQKTACDVHRLDYSFPVKITTILLYSIILLCSLVGNTLLIKVVHKRKELRNTINYFIVNMAVSDFVYPLAGIPEHLVQIASSSQQWPFSGTTGLILCKLKYFLLSAASNVSLQSLVWIALDRFVAVVLPMKVHLISSRFRAFAIGSTWVVAFMANSMYLYVSQLVEKNGEPFCTPFHSTTFLKITYLRVFTALFQIFPLVVMTFLYLVIAVTLRRQDKALQCRAVQQGAQRKRRAIKMSFCVMASFYICFLPMLFVLLCLEYEIELSCLFSAVLWFMAYFALYLSSAINPIICVTFVQSYRLGFKEILNRCWSKRLTTYNMQTAEQQETRLHEIRTIKMEENRIQ